MKRVAGGLKADLAQYRELAAFAQFGSDLDKTTQRQLERGARLMELLKQPQYAPYPLHHQVMLIYAGGRGYLDDVAVDNVDKWVADFLRYMDTAHSKVGQDMADTLDLSDEGEDALKQALVDFNASWSA